MFLLNRDGEPFEDTNVEAEYEEYNPYDNYTEEDFEELEGQLWN